MAMLEINGLQIDVSPDMEVTVEGNRVTIRTKKTREASRDPLDQIRKIASVIANHKPPVFVPAVPPVCPFPRQPRRPCYPEIWCGDMYRTTL